MHAGTGREGDMKQTEITSLAHDFHGSPSQQAAAFENVVAMNPFFYEPFLLCCETPPTIQCNLELTW
jgi:hypothetical protein